MGTNVDEVECRHCPLWEDCSERISMLEAEVLGLMLGRRIVIPKNCPMQNESIPEEETK